MLGSVVTLEAVIRTSPSKTTSSRQEPGQVCQSVYACLNSTPVFSAARRGCLAEQGSCLFPDGKRIHLPQEPASLFHHAMLLLTLECQHSAGHLSLSPLIPSQHVPYIIAIRWLFQAFRNIYSKSHYKKLSFWWFEVLLLGNSPYKIIWFLLVYDFLTLQYSWVN